MINMETVSDGIATIVSRELKLDKNNKEVIAYGTFAILQMFISIILVIIFGLIFHVMIEALIICFTVSILRKYSGGAHSSSPNICIIIGTVICIAEALLISFLIAPLVSPVMLLVLGIVTFAFSYYLVYKLAPVDSPAKPIKTQEKIHKMKKKSIIVLSVYLFIVMLNLCIYFYIKDNRFMVYSLSIYGGITWQSFTLTKLGHVTLNRIDDFFNKVLALNGRRD